MKITTDKLNEMLSVNQENEHGYRENMKRIVMGDGESVSVQSSKYHYCSPRHNHGPWYAVEVGFPSVEPNEEWAEYMDGDWETQDRLETVYGYVPIDLVVDFINEHGGIKD